MIENGMQEGGGYTQLMFAKPNETEELPKINYTAYYEPFDWVMGTGVWIDDLDALELEYSNHAHAALLTSVRNTVIILAVLIAIACSFAFKYVPALSGVTVGFAIIICALVASLIGAAFFPVKDEDDSPDGQNGGQPADKFEQGKEGA
jgi:hypothetical protein